MGSEHVEFVAYTTSLHPDTKDRAIKHAALTVRTQSPWSRDVMLPVDHIPDQAFLH